MSIFNFNKPVEIELEERPPIKEIFREGDNKSKRYFRVEIGQTFKVDGQDSDIVITEIVFREEEYKKFGVKVFGIYAEVDGVESLWKDLQVDPSDHVIVKYHLDF